MSYLEKIVGLSGTTPAPLAGVRLVNTLPIISDAFATGISKTGDTSPINNVWNRTIENAETKLEIDLYNELMKDLRFRQLMSSTIDFGYSSGNTRPASARWEGVRYRVRKQQYTKLTIRQLYVSGSGDFTVKIFDLTSGLVLYTSTSDTTITNEGYIDVNFDLSLIKLQNDFLIAVDCTNIQLNPIDGNKGFFSDNCGGYPITTTSGYILDAQTKSATNFTTSQCFVHVIAEISSDMNSIVSQNVGLFKECAWHLCGHLLLEESLSSDKFNWWTNTNRVVRGERAEAEKEEYMDYLCKLVQPLLMRLNNTNIVEKKDASEKLGIYTSDIISGYWYDGYERLSSNYIPLDHYC